MDDPSLLGANSDFASYNLFAYCGNNPIYRADNGGQLWNIVIGAGVGAIAGLVGQVVTDVVTSLVSGEVKISSWQTYAGSIIGGAAGGVVLAATGSVNAANAITGFVTTGAGMALEKLTNKDYEKSWGEIGVMSTLDGMMAFGLGMMPGMKGVTSGRNNMYAVYKAGLTKLRNGTVAKMSVNVISKGITSSIVSGFALDGYYGLKQAVY